MVHPIQLKNPLFKYLGPLPNNNFTKSIDKPISKYMDNLKSSYDFKVPLNQKDPRSFYDKFIKPQKVNYKSFERVLR